MEEWQAKLSQRFAALYVKHHAASLRTMFSRGRKAGWIPPDCQPFASVEYLRLAPDPLLEGDLPTDDEIKRLFAHASGVMFDLLTVFHATGARTSELLDAKVGDFQRAARTVVLGRHKRAHTLKIATHRTITLNSAAYGVLDRLSRGKAASAYLFTNSRDKPYDRSMFADRFRTLRRRAGVRDEITPYSFRHLWISEALMGGLDSMIVARMAGTSVAMVERVYGHYRTTAFQDAQARLDAVRAARRAEARE